MAFYNHVPHFSVLATWEYVKRTISARAVCIGMDKVSSKVNRVHMELGGKLLTLWESTNLGVTGLQATALMKKLSLHAIRSVTRTIQMRWDIACPRFLPPNHLPPTGKLLPGRMLCVSASIGWCRTRNILFNPCRQRLHYLSSFLPFYPLMPKRMVGE